MAAIQVGETERRILRSLVESGPVQKVVFRIRNENDLEAIEWLVKRGLIDDSQERYNLTFGGFLASESESLQETLARLHTLYGVLGTCYRQDPNGELRSSQFAAVHGFDHSQLKRDLDMLFGVHVGNLWQSRSGYMPGPDDMLVRLGEGFLKLKTFDQWLESTKEYYRQRDSTSTSATSAPTVLPAKPPLPEWRAIKRLGEGGQAIVDLVQRNGRQAARKTLKNKRRAARFLREIEQTKRLGNHPSIVKVLDDNVSEERPHYLLEYCEGGDLERATHWEASDETRLLVFERVCAALSHAHSHGVVHRDIKPGNILFRSGTAADSVAIGDFGLCFADGESRLTETEEAIGPRWFMAPENEAGLNPKVSPAEDVYALGKLLYWMLSGRRRFRREQFDAPGTRLEDVRGDWRFAHFRRVLAASIVEDPKRRFSHAQQLLESTALAMRLFLNANNVVSVDAEQRCTYCGVGMYEVLTENFAIYNRIGVEPRGNPECRALICGSCGHVQLFRVDGLERNPWKA